MFKLTLFLGLVLPQALFASSEGCGLAIQNEIYWSEAGYQPIDVAGIKNRLISKGYTLHTTDDVFLHRQNQSKVDYDTVTLRKIDINSIQYVFTMDQRPSASPTDRETIVERLSFALAARSNHCRTDLGFAGETWCEVRDLKRSTDLPVLSKVKTGNPWGPYYKEAKIPFSPSQVAQMIEELPDCR